MTAGAPRPQIAKVEKAISEGLASNLSACFLYPFAPKYLLVIGVAALLFAIVAPFQVGSEYAYYFILLVVARVGFDIVDRVANGYVRHLETPEDFPSGGFARPLKYWVVVLIMNAFVALIARDYGFGAAVTADIVRTLILLIMVMVLAISGRLLAALDPREWLRVAGATKASFALLAVLSLAFGPGLRFVADLTFHRVYEQMGVYRTLEGLFEAVMVYLWLVNYHMIGLVIYLHRVGLGVVSETDPTEKGPTPEEHERSELQDLEGKVRGSLARGDLKAAEEEAHAAMRADPYHPGKQGLYHQALMAQPDKTKALAHAGRFLGVLLKSGKTTEAVNLFKRCRAVNAEFQPLEAGEALPIAKAARALKDPTTAIGVLRGFDKRNPGHADIPAVYVFSARLLCEDLGDAEMAKRILEHVLKKYPGHSIAAEAGLLLKTLQAPAVG